MAHNPVNIKLLTKLTGWQPPADVQDGVERALTWL
jgi:nucleoside-diphosphate-sugar epimerase